MNRLLEWLLLPVLLMTELMTGAGLLLIGVLFMSLLSSLAWALRCAAILKRRLLAPDWRWSKPLSARVHVALSSGTTRQT